MPGLLLNKINVSDPASAIHCRNLMSKSILKAGFVSLLGLCLGLLLQTTPSQAAANNQNALGNTQKVSTPLKTTQKLQPKPVAFIKEKAKPAINKKTLKKNRNKLSAPESGQSGKLAASLKNAPSKAAAPADLPLVWPPVLWPEDGSTLHRLVGKNDSEGPAVLVVGGIQGDEPGGFSAASLLVTNYKVTKGQLWVVPSLNLPSMVSRNRGVYGDMNRKFAFIAQNDPDLPVISRIKELILNPKISLVLNLHDGSGFYSPKDEGPRRNPRRWGQSLIIDQSYLAGPGSLSLEQMGVKALADANANLVSHDHRLNLYNTRTSEGDKEMEKTLSYFAVCNGKAAFGLEASKDFTTEYRAYYHLLMIESLLSQHGLEFERNLELSPKGVLQALNNGVSLAMWDNRVVLPLENVRKSITMLPMKKGLEFSASPSKPIVTVSRAPGAYQVHYGNRLLTQVKPLFLDFDTSLEKLDLVVDGQRLSAKVGDIINVDSDFIVPEIKGFRVNAIGAPGGDPKRNGCESDIKLAKKDFLPGYSVDNGANIYRVELYKGEAFAGMVLVRFGQADGTIRTADAQPTGAVKQNTPGKGKNSVAKTPDVLPGIKGRESSLGF